MQLDQALKTCISELPYKCKMAKKLFIFKDFQNLVFICTSSHCMPRSCKSCFSILSQEPQTTFNFSENFSDITTPAPTLCTTWIKYRMQHFIHNRKHINCWNWDISPFHGKNYIMLNFIAAAHLKVVGRKAGRNVFSNSQQVSTIIGHKRSTLERQILSEVKMGRSSGICKKLLLQVVEHIF